MTYTAIPWIEIDDRRVKCSANAMENEPVIVESFTIKWGRSGYYDSTEPAHLTFTLWDATDQWAIAIRDSQALGKRVKVRWPGATQFVGAIASATARRTTYTTDEGVYIWQIMITAVDPLAALGNIYPLPGVLPAGETMEQRSQWLKSLAGYGGVDFFAIDYHNRHANARTKPVEVGGESALELFTAFYASMSNDAMTYDPETNYVRQCERHYGEFGPFLESVYDDRGAVMITSGTTIVNGTPREGIPISGCKIIVEDGLEISATTDTDINRVESTWSDPLDEWNDKVAYRESIAVGQPRRVLNYETWITTDWSIEYQLESAWNRARAEGRHPRHPRITYRPGKTFTDQREAVWWLRCWENTRPAFINGDAAHTWLMQSGMNWAPIVSPLGGTVTYHAKTGWSITLDVQWMGNADPITPRTWIQLMQRKIRAELPTAPWWWKKAGLTAPVRAVGVHLPERDIYWGPPDPATPATRKHRFDESITWGDMKYLDNERLEIRDY